jgi:hypothetical protein
MQSIASRFIPVLILSLFTTSSVHAAPAPPADEKAEADARLDAVLREWAKASDAIHESHFTIRVSELDSVTEKTSTSSIEVFVRKPDLIRIDTKDHKSGLVSGIYKERIIRVLSSVDKTDHSYPLSDVFGFPEHPERYPDDWIRNRAKITYRNWPCDCWPFGAMIR